MSMPKKKMLVFMGRFSPCHIGHTSVFNQALQLAEYLTILVGSSNQPRTPKNPWTFEERAQMILLSIPPDFHNRVIILPLRDKKYNNTAWAQQVQKAVNCACARTHLDPIADVGVIGHSKDSTSFYLHLFPQWGKPIEVDAVEAVNATDIRNTLLSKQSFRYIQGAVTPEVLAYLRDDFTNSNAYVYLIEEYRMIADYKKSWAGSPYPPVFITADTLVVKSGHIVLGTRRASPGKGQLALPGGFVNSTETFKQAALRELREETRIKVAPRELEGSIIKDKCYDDPERSLRGRTVTHAFLCSLSDGGPLPAIKGGDDMIAPRWVPLMDIREIDMFEDHYHIIQDMLGMYDAWG